MNQTNFYMNMKSFNKLAIAAVATAMILSAPGCKKFLDQEPETEVTAPVVFSDVANARKALAGAYSRLVGDAAYGIRLSLYYTVDNDEMQGPSGASDNDRRDIARYIATSTNAQLSAPFNQLFQGIEFANLCIENIPQMELYKNGSDQEQKQLRRMHGEALALRAQYYFEAVRNWGDLPDHFQSAYKQIQLGQYPSRIDRDTIYNRLLADLSLAATLVPWKSGLSSIGEAPDERLTKGAIKGLRARIALFCGGYSLRQEGGMKRGSNHTVYYQIAKDETNDIINSGEHTLNPSFKSLWRDQVCGRAVADPHGELMFQASGFGSSSAEDTKLGYYNGPRVNNLGNSSINPLATYFYLFDSTDTRRDVTIAPYFVAANGTTKIGQAMTAINDGKYRRDWIKNPVVSPTDQIQYFGLKWQILRYSDVLLMYAEAENELNGPTSSAYNALNMVRRRGFDKPVNTPDAAIDIPSGLSKTDFFKYLVRERSLELGGEGVRKYDLIRWNLLGTAITETRANLIKLSTITPMVDYTYQASFPSYVKVSTLPASMYYKNNNASDDVNLWANSFYKPAPTSTPSGTTRVNWLQAAVNTTSASRYATGFVTGKGELLPIPQAARDANPNLSQNPGY